MNFSAQLSAGSGTYHRVHEKARYRFTSDDLKLSTSSRKHESGWTIRELKQRRTDSETRNSMRSIAIAPLNRSNRIIPNSEIRSFDLFCPFHVSNEGCTSKYTCTQSKVKRTRAGTMNGVLLLFETLTVLLLSELFQASVQHLRLHNLFVEQFDALRLYKRIRLSTS